MQVQPKKLKVLTLNAQRSFCRDALFDYLKKSLEDRDYDFFLFQELCDDARNLLKDMSKRYGYSIIDGITGKHHRPQEIMVLYKDTFDLVESHVLSFAKEDDHDRTRVGFVGGMFSINQTKLFLGSLHLPAYAHFKMRSICIRKIKQCILNELALDPGANVIFGGDFNNIFDISAFFSFEERVHNKLLSPELTRVPFMKGYTYQSKHIEPSGFNNNLVRFLGKVGLNFKPSLDKFYINSQNLKQFKLDVKRIEVQVSDHYPLELEVEYINQPINQYTN